MKQLVYSSRVADTEAMKKLEEFIGLLLKGENHQCSFVRGKDFVSMRIQALYKEAPATPIVVYGENLKIVLDSQKIVSVYTMEPTFVDESDAFAVTGKRSAPDTPTNEL